MSIIIWFVEIVLDSHKIKYSLGKNPYVAPVTEAIKVEMEKGILEVSPEFDQPFEEEEDW